MPVIVREWGRWWAVLALACGCSGCAVVAVADAVVTTAAVVVKTTVKVAGAAVDAVIPDGEPKKD